jgi:Transglycosylase-like domain
MPLSPSFLRARLLRVVAVAAFAAGVTTACFPAKEGPPSGSHHDDPFLTCARQRESGGRYTVDSPGGQYHGAYQFVQSTWDSTARHVGRTDLVGVDPHTAAPATQDDMAWALYQWQGTQPWAGVGC